MTKRRSNGAGSVLARGGRFTALVSDPATGKRRSVGTFAARAEAERAIEEAAAGMTRESGDSFGRYLLGWIDRHSSYVSATMTDRYRGDAKRYVLGWPIAKLRLDALTADDFEEHYAALAKRGGKAGRPLGRETVRGVERMLVSAIMDAVAKGKLGRSPLPLHRLPKVRRERPWANASEVARLIRQTRLTDPELEVAVRLGALYGFRRGEVGGLDWSDVDGSLVRIRQTRGVDNETGRAKVKPTKTAGSRATVEVDDATRAAIAALRSSRGRPKPSEPVYATEDGEALYPDTLSERFSRIVKAYNVTYAGEELGDGFTFHSLRHSFASNLIAAGVPTLTVAAAGRWSSTALVEQTYGHLAPSTVGEAVARLAAAVDAL
jgi:integrase